MAMKEDWSFLDKISMGANATIKVTELLNANGHRIIELERYSSSNKMWATKIKRLRIPDLLCLSCGRRIESRAKSKLGIIMSDSPTNHERRWDAGLRDEDLVAFINCHKSNDSWIAAEIVNLFRIEDLRNTVEYSKLGPAKSASEGAERDRSWGSYVPSFDGRVDAIEDNKIKFIKADGKRYSKGIPAGYYVFVNENEVIIGGTKIVASIVNCSAELCCDNRGYDFLNDLDSDIKETVYCAVKALGFLPEIKDLSIPKLEELLQSETLDERIKLETNASLIRLGIDTWSFFEQFIISEASQEFLMETVLILSELTEFAQAQDLLTRISTCTNYQNEIRAAAIWGMGSQPTLHDQIVNLIAEKEEIVSTHAIAILEKAGGQNLTRVLLDEIGNNDRKSSAIARIISQVTSLNDREIVKAYVTTDNINKKQWLLYSFGLSGSERFERLIDELDLQANETKSKLQLLWHNHRNWISREKIDNIEFTKLQN